MATPPPDLPAGTPWWVGAGLGAVSTVGGIVITALTMLRRGGPAPATPTGDASDGDPTDLEPRHARPPFGRSGTDEVLAMAERQWDRERARYEEERDELKAEIRALTTRVGQLEQEVRWNRDMLERFAPRRPGP